MWRIFFTGALAAVALAGCQQSNGGVGGGREGWRMGPSLGPMMAYGYCPSTANDERGGERGWYGSGMMGASGSMMGRGMMGSQGFDPAATTAWLDRAKQQIGVTAAQEAAWSAYADAVEADRASMLQMHEQMPAMMAAGGNAADRLQTHVGLMSARVSSLQQVEDATRALYAVLTAEQRTRADQVLWSGCWR